MAGLSQSEKTTLGVLGVLALILAATASKMAPGGSVKVPASQTADWLPFTPPPDRPVVGPDQHVGGYVFTPHRYPPACGSDITVLIHDGFSTAALPSGSDMLWLSNPPSEDSL